MPGALHQELSDRDRLTAMHLTVSELRDTMLRTLTLIDQSRAMLREIKTLTDTPIDRR